jgi:hypothetical protein
MASGRYVEGEIAGRRQAFEHIAAQLRRKLTAWREAEAKRNPVVAALLWSINELWRTRLEAFAAELDGWVGVVRAQEADLAKSAAAARARPKRKRGKK